jgi:hypothetical protein
VPPFNASAQQHAGLSLEEAGHRRPIGHDVQDARKEAVDDAGQQAGAEEAEHEVTA